jgi:hypothetical protein
MECDFMHFFTRAFFGLAFLIATFTTQAAAAVQGRYVRVDDPTGYQMCWNQIQIFSGDQNIVLGHPEYFSGTVYPDHHIKTSDGRRMTDGDTDVKKSGGYFQGTSNTPTAANGLDPWFEVDFGRSISMDKIVLYGSRYPEHFYLDKGDRVVSVLDENRKVVWAGKFNYYRTTDAVFTLTPVEGERNPAVGMVVAAPLENGTATPLLSDNWVPMNWLLDADKMVPLPDAASRMKRFEARNSPYETERLAYRLISLIDPRTPGIAPLFQLYQGGHYQQALDAWKIYWFAKMTKVNLHWAIQNIDAPTYPTNGDDLVKGIAVTIASNSARAIRFIPGQIHWIDLPKEDDPGFQNALSDAQDKAAVDAIGHPLLEAYGRKQDPRYLQTWSAIMDDWSMNYFDDAQKSPYDVENLFTFSPGLSWEKTMENLSDLAIAHPEAIRLIPSGTLARMQLICLEKYPTGWWRQARETTFNHLNGGICAYYPIAFYIQEFYPGQRTQQEWQQAFERFITMATERDGSLTEISDEGHMEIPIQDGGVLAHAEQTKQAWYTPGWHNRAMEWYDNIFRYMFRHLAPGGYEHRDAVDYRTYRWTSTYEPYFNDRPQIPRLNRDAVIFGMPEVRRMLDAWGHISSGVPQAPTPAWQPIVDAQKKTHDEIAALLGSDKPGMPQINSDWMPYTGEFNFRGSWADDAPFIGMMACGSHGGSNVDVSDWPFSTFYYYDYKFPLVAAQPVQIDGLPLQQAFGRWYGYNPGTKTMFLTNADEKPEPFRWLSDDRFDFGEAVFQGGYQNKPGDKGDGQKYDVQQLDPGPFIANVKTTRQIVQIRGSRLFVVTDSIQTPGQDAHTFSVPYRLSLSALQKNPSRPFSPQQLQTDDKTDEITTDNPDGPSVRLYQFANLPIQYARGPDVVVDTQKYGKRLGPDIGVADQHLSVDLKGNKLNLVSLISSRDTGAEDRVASIQSLTGSDAVGFHATLRAGGEIWYETASGGETSFQCGPVRGSGQALLVTEDKNGISGLVLGARQVALNGTPLTITSHDFEFVKSAGVVTIRPIYTPIDPLSFEPNRNTFSDTETVKIVSKTPNLEIHYTTDGTAPGLSSKLYTGPITITATTEFAARGYRLGANGKPLPANDFEINGTKFTLPCYGWFYKKPMKPALAAPANLQAGLNYDYVQGPWSSLFSNEHWLPAAGGGMASREMDLSKVSTTDYYGMRYCGYIKVPQAGLYTFYAPEELSYMTTANSYDLRVYVDGEEWYLTQWWHGHGTWTVPLAAGLHTFQVDFADGRTKPLVRSGIWNFYPRPWAVRLGNPSDILISGPGVAKGRIPQEWLYRQPIPRSFPDERVLVDSLNQVHCAFDGAIDVPMNGVKEICFKSSGNLRQVFANVTLVKPDGTTETFAQLANQGRMTPQGLVLDIQDPADRMTGMLDPDPNLHAVVVSNNALVEAPPPASDAPPQ